MDELTVLLLLPVFIFAGCFCWGIIDEGIENSKKHKHDENDDG